jgi:hypothetical protein
MNLRETIKKVLKEDTNFSLQFKRRITLFKEFIKNCFVYQNPCDYEDFYHFMQGIYSEVEEYASGIYDADDNNRTPDWLTYEEGVDFVETHMMDELKDYYFQMCQNHDLYEETSRDNTKKDLSPKIKRVLQSIIERENDIVCGVEVTAPWNRESLEFNRPFRHYKILVKFIGGPGTDYYPLTRDDEDMYHNIMDEMWQAVYNYLGLATDLYSQKNKKCEETKKEEETEGVGGYAAPAFEMKPDHVHFKHQYNEEN